MKKTIRILLPIILVLAIILCTCWYLFIYDRGFTRDVLLSCARYSESQGNHTTAAWIYKLAYAQSDNSDAVACELAQQYKSVGNYTKAEFTLSNAIADGGGIDVYIALSKTYVEQDKLLDAVNMLNGVGNEEIKAQLETLRPKAPTATPDPGFYRQYISVTLHSDSGTVYARTDGEYPSVKHAPYDAPLTLSDGENILNALVVADNGLVSPLAIYGYTVGGVVELMQFSDPAIEASVRETLGVSADKPLYTNDLWQIKEFTVPADAQSYADIKYLTFLEKLYIDNGISSELGNLSSLSNLTQLSITGTDVSQEVLSSIAVLPKLKGLTLRSCNLSGVAPLKDAVGLTALDLSGNTIRTIDSLGAITGLQELNLEENAVVDLTALTTNTALTKLDISSNAVSTLAPLSGLQALTWLDAGANSITDLGDLGRLNTLTYLDLRNNQLASIDSLASCTALSDLNISTNALSNIDALGELDALMYLDFSYNQVTALPTFSKDCALVSVTGTNNLISKLDNLAGLSQLNYVHMDYNTEITSVSVLADCHRLIEVNVYATKVTDVTSLTNQSVIVNYNPVQNG